MSDALTEKQQEFIHRLQYQEMDQIAEDLEFSLDDITDWQKNRSFQLSMMESVSLLKQKVRHRVLLRCLSLMDSLDHLQEHINQKEQTRILEHVAGIINKVEIVEESVMDSIRQQEIEDARCWREYSKDQRKILAWERYKREFAEWKKNPKDPDLLQPPPSTFELFFDYTGPVNQDEDEEDEEDDYDEDDVEPEDQGHDHNLDQEQSVAPLPFRGGAGAEVERGQEQQPAQSSYAQPNSPPRVGEGPGEGSNEIMDQQQMSADSAVDGHSGIQSGGRRTFSPYGDDKW